jgi:hypothetical protein
LLGEGSRVRFGVGEDGEWEEEKGEEEDHDEWPRWRIHLALEYLPWIQVGSWKILYIDF